MQGVAATFVGKQKHGICFVEKAKKKLCACVVSAAKEEDVCVQLLYICMEMHAERIPERIREKARLHAETVRRAASKNVAPLCNGA